MESPNELTELIAAVQKMQQQLVYLEKKIDTLLKQSSSPAPQRPHFRDRGENRYGGGGQPQGHWHRGPRRERSPHERSGEGEHKFFEKRKSFYHHGKHGGRGEARGNY